MNDESDTTTTGSGAGTAAGSNRDGGGGRPRYRGGRDEVLMAALASGMTQREAAAAARVSARTVRRRLAEPNFAERISEIRRSILDQATGMVCAKLSEAVETIEELLKPPASPAVRLRAAQILLEKGNEMVRGEELLSRLGALEDTIDAERARLAEEDGG